MKNKQVKHFAFTWNNYHEVDYKDIITRTITELNINYIVYGFEIAPTTGTKHLQGYAQTEKRVYLSKINKCLPKVHITVCNGSSQDNINYCKKLDDFFEEGEARTEARRVKKCKDDWETLVKLAEDGRIEDIRQDYPQEFLCYYRTFKQIAQDNLKPQEQERRAYWIWGKPGLGKSRAVHQLFPHAYWKNANKWWDGYKGEKVVVLDDLGTAHLYEHLKRWADRYPVIGEVKGSSIGLSYEVFIVTSNFPISGEQSLLIPGETIRAIERRFEEVEAVFWVEDAADLLVLLDVGHERLWPVLLTHLEHLHDNGVNPQVEAVFEHPDNLIHQKDRYRIDWEEWLQARKY